MTDLKKEIDSFIASSKRRQMIDGKNYYEGENTTINNIRKTYWSDKYKREMDNPYVSNYKIGYSFFHDMVSQKVNTLLNETLTIESKYKFDKKFMREFGYALKQAGIKAASQGRAYIYLSYDNKFRVFDTEYCIPIFDETDTYLIEFIRYWDVLDRITGQSIRYVEHYSQEGIDFYKDFKLVSSTPYKETIYYDMEDELHQPTRLTRLPIFILYNNDSRKSDLTPNIKSKIDAIDIVKSGFMNNIEDFSDVYWLIKNGSGMTSDEFEDFAASITKTRKLVTSGDGEDSLQVEAKQLTIPTEARSKFVEQIKLELVEDSGVIDTQSMTGSSLTTTAIKAATMKLRQRVSDFEWQVYNIACEIIEMYKEFNNVMFDYDIEFTKLLVDNETEILTNAISIKNDISKRTYFQLLKRANYISDVDAELKAVEEERAESFTLVDEELPEENEVEEDASGQGAQAD